MSAKKSVHARRFAADPVVVELVVVLHASKELETIVQSRCLGLTWTDIYSTNATRQHNAIISLVCSSASIYDHFSMPMVIYIDRDGDVLGYLFMQR